MKYLAAGLLAAATLAALPLVSAPARATVISGTASFADNGPANNGLTFSGSADNAAITNLNLTLDTPVTISSFLTINSNDTSGFFGSNATDNISVAFDFTVPSSGSGTLSGQGSEDVASFFGVVTGASGAINWQNPLTIDFTDGAILQLSLAEVSFNVSGNIFDPANPDQTLEDALTLTLIQAPDASGTSVPEPGSLVLLATGLIGIGLVTRRRRRA